MKPFIQELQILKQVPLVRSFSKYGPSLMSSTSDTVPEYSGIEYERVREIRSTNLSPALTPYYSKPLLIHSGSMQWLYDEQGKKYLDLFGGIVTVSVGHCHPRVTEDLIAQTKKLWHTTNIYLHPNIHEYAEKLTSTLPGNLKVAYFVNSGSEANDMALLLARLYTGHFDAVSLRNAYHGASPYALGLTATNHYRYRFPNGFGVHHAMNPDPYRGLWGGFRDSPVQSSRCHESHVEDGVCSSTHKYIGQLQELLQYSVPKGGLAGIFIESIQGVGGTVQFPLGYVKEAFELTRANGGVCISDEVQTGFGRTGDHFWGFEGHGVLPDIVTMAKGIGNGFPLAAVVTTPEIARAMTGAMHFNTFGGSPLSTAVGLSVLKVLEEEDIQSKAREIGTYFIGKLGELRAKHEIIGDVRGKGLMLGVEMVEDKTTRTPLPPHLMLHIFDFCKNNGVLFGRGGYYSNVFRAKPPMCITKDDVDFAVAVFEEGVISCMDCMN